MGIRAEAMKWIGIYNIADDSFTVWQANFKPTNKMHIEFTKKECEAIAKAWNGAI